ncbi:MAG: metalloregulator ArsR/SmtB family transcription factor [Tepidisphaeraceae bacterium]|jgi:DNA-binding transcriptional ArsR family regulator
MELDAANPAFLARIVERFSALADESRIRLLMRLKSSPANVGTLSAELGIGQASVSKHLGLLKRVGIVDCERKGTQCIYFVKDQPIFNLCRLVCDGVTRHVEEEHAALMAGKPGKKGPKS